MRRTVKALVLTILFAITCVEVPMLGLPPLATSTLLSTILFLATLVIGIAGGLVTGTLGPGFLLLKGALSPDAQAVMPLMIGANAVLVTTFGLLTDQNIWVSVPVASACKCVLLMILLKYAAVLTARRAWSFLVSQFFGAILGGSAAVFIYNALPRRYNLS